MAANKFLPRCAPIWGFPMHMTIADFAPTKQKAVAVLTDVVVTTLSPIQSVGARSVELTFLFTNGNATFDLNLFTALDGYAAPIKSWTGLTNNPGYVFAGNLERVDLDGYPLKIQVVNPTDKVSVLLSVTS